MSDHGTKLPPAQEAIRDKCFHPSGTFVEFKKEEIEQSIPERFEKIVQMYPQRIAVKTNAGTLTYDALNRAGNRVSYAILDKLGEQVEPVVLIAGQDSRTIISCLGILKAGKILVAVDPAYPSKRIKHIIDDCQVQVILTGNADLPLAMDRANTSGQVINTDALDRDLLDKTFALQISPDAPAEIRYSSGSTGQPKGIVRSHRRLLYSAMISINSARICPDDRLVVLRNMSFGSRDFMRGLLGGTAIFPFDIKRDGLSKLPVLLSEEKITICAMVSTTFRYFMTELSENETFAWMRLIQVGAERLTRSEIDSFKKHFSPNCILMHRLSCGEAGNICQYFIDHNTDISTSIVPAGYPVEGKEILILDETYKDIGVNEIGEIAVRSRYLSSEYWGNPDLTGTKFLPDPNGGDERIYLTGDIGRLSPDGCVVHLGRKDLMVKIRGHRVELIETESALLEYPAVRDVGVVAWDRGPGEKYLVAYVVPRQEPAPTINELRNFLKKKLPDYMVPSAFVFMESLPLTNGKLDRKALPKPDDERPELSQPYAPPHSGVEMKLAHIWAEVLSHDRVGIHDNFFDLGGHSLAASRIIARIIKTFELELPIKALFDSPTVADTAALIMQNQAKKASEQDLERLLSELESMSETEAERTLVLKTSKRDSIDGKQ